MADPIPDGRRGAVNGNAFKWVPLIIAWTLQFAGIIWGAATMANKLESLNTTVGGLELDVEAQVQSQIKTMLDVRELQVKVDNLDIRRR